MRLRQLLPAVVVSFVASGVAELLYRGYVGASQRWADEPADMFELYTYGLPPGTGKEVAALFCGKLAERPIVVREHADALTLRDRLRYRVKRRPAAALLALPVNGAKPTPFETVLYHSLLISDLARPAPEVRTLRDRLIEETRFSGALPILIGDTELARRIEAPSADKAEPAALAKALGAQRGEPPRCLSQATGR